MVGLCVLLACCHVSCVSTLVCARDYPPVIFMVYLIFLSVLALPSRRSKNLVALIHVYFADFDRILLSMGGFVRLVDGIVGVVLE